MASNNKESFAIKLSIYGSIIMTITGILASILGNSISLLFDALNTLIAIVISIAGLHISKLLKIKYSSRFNFGYYSFEPLFVLINGLLLMTLAVSLFISSIQTIISGGRIIELTVVTEYLILSVIICSCESFILKYYARKTKSEILHAESISWILDTIISVAVLFVFSMSIWLKKTQYSFLIPYLDPGITIILILSFVYQPFKLIKSGIFDLLLAAPPKNSIKEIKEKLISNKYKYGFTEIKIHAAKIGRTTCIEIICFYDKYFEIKTMGTLDVLKNQIKIEVKNYSQNLEVKVSFKTLHE
jgi:cation diffusion facilitator family transporter